MNAEQFRDKSHQPPTCQPAGVTPPTVQVSVTAHRDGNAEILTITGELDMCTSPQVWKEIHRHLAHRPALLVVDLSGVTFLGLSGLEILAQASAAPHTALRVVARRDVVLRPMQITGLDEVLPVFDTVQHALVAD